MQRTILSKIYAIPNVSLLRTQREGGFNSGGYEQAGNLKMLYVSKSSRPPTQVKDWTDFAMEDLDGTNVFAWLNNLSQCMVTTNKHPFVIGMFILGGNAMSEKVRKDLKDAEETLIAHKPKDHRDAVDCAEWLEELYLWLVNKYGARDRSPSASDVIKEQRLKTRSLAGVKDLFEEIMKHVPRLPVADRTYIRVLARLEEAIERNTYINESGKKDPKALVARWRNTINVSAGPAIAISTGDNRLNETGRTEEEKFVWLKAVVEWIHLWSEDARRGAQDPTEYASEGTLASAVAGRQQNQRRAQTSSSALTIHAASVEQESGGDSQHYPVLHPQHYAHPDYSEYGFGLDYLPMWHSTDNPIDAEVEEENIEMLNHNAWRDQAEPEREGEYVMCHCTMIVHQMPMGQRCKCGTCGFTGHEYQTCSIGVKVNPNDPHSERLMEIDKNEAARIPGEKRLTRLKSAWERGEVLWKECRTIEEFNIYVASVNAIAATLEQSGSSGYNAGGRGGGGGRGYGGSGPGNGGGRGFGGGGYGGSGGYGNTSRGPSSGYGRGGGSSGGRGGNPYPYTGDAGNGGQGPSGNTASGATPMNSQSAGARFARQWIFRPVEPAIVAPIPAVVEVMVQPSQVTETSAVEELLIQAASLGDPSEFEESYPNEHLVSQWEQAVAQAPLIHSCPVVQLQLDTELKAMVDIAEAGVSVLHQKSWTREGGDLLGLQKAYIKLGGCNQAMKAIYNDPIVVAVAMLEGKGSQWAVNDDWESEAHGLMDDAKDGLLSEGEGAERPQSERHGKGIIRPKGMSPCDGIRTVRERCAAARWGSCIAVDKDHEAPAAIFRKTRNLKVALSMAQRAADVLNAKYNERLRQIENMSESARVKFMESTERVKRWSTYTTAARLRLKAERLLRKADKIDGLDFPSRSSARDGPADQQTGDASGSDSDDEDGTSGTGSKLQVNQQRVEQLDELRPSYGKKSQTSSRAEERMIGQRVAKEERAIQAMQRKQGSARDRSVQSQELETKRLKAILDESCLGEAEMREQITELKVSMAITREELEAALKAEAAEMATSSRLRSDLRAKAAELIENDRYQSELTNTKREAEQTAYEEGIKYRRNHQRSDHGGQRTPVKETVATVGGATPVKGGTSSGGNAPKSAAPVVTPVKGSVTPVGAASIKKTSATKKDREGKELTGALSESSPFKARQVSPPRVQANTTRNKQGKLIFRAVVKLGQGTGSVSNQETKSSGTPARVDKKARTVESGVGASGDPAPPGRLGSARTQTTQSGAVKSQTREVSVSSRVEDVTDKTSISESSRVQDITDEISINRAEIVAPGAVGMTGVLMMPTHSEVKVNSAPVQNEVGAKEVQQPYYPPDLAFNNANLVYMYFKVRAPTDKDCKMGYRLNELILPDKDTGQSTAYLDTGQKFEKMRFADLPVQYDGGAGSSVISAKFADLMGLQRQTMRKPLVVNSYTGEANGIRQFVVVVIEVEGLDIHGKRVRKKFSVRAMVSEVLHVEFLLGSDAGEEHGIVSEAGSRSATIFKGDDMLKLQCMEWGSVQSALQTRNVARKMQIVEDRMRALNVHAVRVGKPLTGAQKRQGASEARPEGDLEVVDTGDDESAEAAEILTPVAMGDSGMSLNLEQMVVKYCEQQTKSVGSAIGVTELNRQRRAIVKAVLGSPTSLFNAVPISDSKNKKSMHRHTLAAILIVSEMMEMAHLRESVLSLHRAMFLGSKLEYVGEKEFASLMRGKKQLAYVANIVAIAVELQVKDIAEQIVPLTVHSAPIVEATFLEAMEREAAELVITIETLAKLRQEECTDSMRELRPPEFPEELWPMVFDGQKPEVLKRFSKFDGDLERKAATIANIMKIDISMETAGRRLEAPYFRAMALANIDRFAHPDKYKQPRVAGFQFEIKMREGQAEPYRAKYQNYDYWQTRFLQLKMQVMKSQERIEDSNSPWNSRLSLVPYMDRITAFVEKHKHEAINALQSDDFAAEVLAFFRLTTDLRNVNDKTVARVFMLPSIPAIIARCSGSDRFSVGDIEDAFFTVLMEELSREFTAFTTPCGHYQYRVMPQGAKNAATFWAEMIARIFQPITVDATEPLIVFQDDVGNFGKELIAHLKTQQKILDVLRGSDMIFKPSKMHFNFMTQRILGQVLSSKGRQPDPKTIEAIMKLKTPETLADVRSLLGLFQYSREYIPSMANILQPIQELTLKGVDVKAAWKPEIHGAAFEMLKVAMTTAPILKVPDISKPFKVLVDACRVGRGIGAVLAQEDEHGVLRPCMYWSRSLAKNERRCSATELECCGLHDAILHWKTYLRNGHEFECVVDHYALVYMVTKMASEQQNQRLNRLCLDLQGFHFKVTHIAGEKHLAADAISRMLRQGEAPHVRDESELRDDWGPLKAEEMVRLQEEFPKDAHQMAEIIEEFRQHRREAREEEQRRLLAAAAVSIPVERVVSSQEVPETNKEGAAAVEVAINKLSTEALARYTIRCGGVQKALHHAPDNKTLQEYANKVAASKISKLMGDIKAARQQRTIVAANELHRACVQVENMMTRQSNALRSRGSVRDNGLSQMENMFLEKRLYQFVRPTLARLCEVSNMALERAVVDERLNEESQFRVRQEIDLRRVVKETRGIEGLKQQPTSWIWRHLEADSLVEESEATQCEMEIAGRALRREWLHTKRQGAASRSQRCLARSELTAEDYSESYDQELQIHALYINTSQVDGGLSQGVATPNEEAIRQKLLTKADKNRQKAYNKQLKDIEERRKATVKEMSQSSKGMDSRVRATKEQQRAEGRAEEARLRDERDEDEVIDRRLRVEFDHLISQHYMEGDTLREIIDVKVDSVSRQAVAISKVVEDVINTMEDKRLAVLEVQGERGALVRVAQFHEGRKDFGEHAVPVTDAEWLEWQLKDAYCRPILDKLDNARGEVHVLDGKAAADTQDWLYRVVMNDGTAGPLQRRSTRVRSMHHKNLQVDIAQEMHQMVVPEAMVEKVMWLVHDCMGHPGRNRTSETMRLKFHWPQVARDIKRHTQKCRYCNLRKANRQGGAAEIMTYDPSDRPGVRVHMDQCGPFPVSFNGAVYILVLKDSLTKFITLIALDGKDMLTVQNAYLTQYLTVFGAPQVLITDRGTEFHNSKAMGIAKLFGVRKISTTPNNPQSDGLAENQMGTLKDMLTSFISAHQRDWDEYLQVVAHSYNNTVNDATGFTPHFLTFGTEMGRVEEEHLQTVEFSKWQETVSADKEALMWCWSAVGERVVKNVEKFKRAPVAPHAPHEYKTGDYCYLRVVPKRSHKTHKAEKEWILANKLQYRFAGPYCVISQMSPILYRLRVHGKERVVHLRSMKAASKMEATHRVALKPVWEGPVELERPLTAGVAVNSVCMAGTWDSSEEVEYEIENWEEYEDVIREDCDTWREIMRERE